MLRNNSNTVRGIHIVNKEVEERKGCSGKDLQRRKVLSLERKSEWVMEYQITVSMALECATQRCVLGTVTPATLKRAATKLEHIFTTEAISSVMPRSDTLADCKSEPLQTCMRNRRDGHGLGPSMGWVGLNEKYCGIVAEYCKTHTFRCS